MDQEHSHKCQHQQFTVGMLKPRRIALFTSAVSGFKVEAVYTFIKIVSLWQLLWRRGISFLKPSSQNLTNYVKWVSTSKTGRRWMSVRMMTQCVLSSSEFPFSKQKLYFNDIKKKNFSSHIPPPLWRVDLAACDWKQIQKMHWIISQSVLIYVKILFNHIEWHLCNHCLH